MTSTTDPRALVALLRADTKGRLAKMGLNTDAADALTALLGENKRLRCALKPLADEAFQNMAGGKGHLIDDAYYALKGTDQ